MANGRLGSASLAAATLTNVYAGPTAGYAVVDVNFVNTTGSPVTIQLAMSMATTASAVQPQDYVVYNRTLAPYDEYERTGEPLSQNEAVWAAASQSGVSVRVKGFENLS